MGSATTLEDPARLGHGPHRPVVRDPLNGGVREVLLIAGVLATPGPLALWIFFTLQGRDAGWMPWALTGACSLVALAVLALDISIPRRRWVAFDRPLAADPPGALILPVWTAGRLRAPGWADDPVGRLTLDGEGIRLHHGVGRGSRARWLPGDTEVRWAQVEEAAAVRDAGGAGARRWFWRHPGVVLDWVDEHGRVSRDHVVVVQRWTGRDRLGLARELAALMNERADQARPEAWGRYEAGAAAAN